MNRVSIFATAAFVALIGVRVRGQDPTVEARLRALESENHRIHERLVESERRNAALEERLAVESSDRREAVEAAQLEDYVSALETSHALDEWSRATKSGMALRFYGFLRFDTYYQTGRTDNVVIPSFALPEDRAGIEDNDDVFAFDVRLTRFAFDLDAGKIGDAAVRGKLETDFANFPAGVAESRETPRIRLAYIAIDFGEIALRIGQDWDVVSPLFPSVNSETLMWNAGNLGDRRPQFQIRYTTGPAEGTIFSVILAAGLTGAIDNADIDGSGERDGFDSGTPDGQLRLGVDTPSWVDGKRTRLGFWAAVGSTEVDVAIGGDKCFTTWLVGLDWDLPLTEDLSFRGEGWYGQALRDFRGNISQFINTATGDELRGFGAFAELVWQVSSTVRLGIGGSFDRVEDDDLELMGPFNVARELNWTMYLTSTYDWTGGLRSGLDVIYWETDWVDEGIGNLVRVNFYTMLTF